MSNFYEVKEMSEEKKRELRKEYEAKHHKSLIAAFIFFLFILMMLPIFMMHENDIYVAVLIAGFAVFIIYILSLGVHKCPICGGPLGRRTLADKYCPRCGEQYRE